MEGIENPYRLARDIRGIGFRTADQIASRLGVERAAPIRVRAGVSFALAEAIEGGHCGLPEAELIQATAALLEVDAPLAAQALTDELPVELSRCPGRSGSGCPHALGRGERAALGAGRHVP